MESSPTVRHIGSEPSNSGRLDLFMCRELYGSVHTDRKNKVRVCIRPGREHRVFEFRPQENVPLARRARSSLLAPWFRGYKVRTHWRRVQQVMQSAIGERTHRALIWH